MLIIYFSNLNKSINKEESNQEFKSQNVVEIKTEIDTSV